LWIVLWVMIVVPWYAPVVILCVTGLSTNRSVKTTIS